jgi:undecaprenyl-diphosphatase
VDLLQSIILGLIQGLTEFLPISSSGHILIVPALLGWDDPGAAFTAVIQLGTEAAVLLYFRKDLWNIAVTWTSSLFRPELRADLNARMGWYLIAATIPIGILGLTFENQIETAARSLWIVGTMLIVFGIVLGVADRYGSRDRDIGELSFRDGVLIGFAQSLALIPGVSRSGATISAGLFLGLDRAAAARFSFLLAIPAVVISGFFQLYGILSGEEAVGEPLLNIAAATLVAFISGYLVIAWLLRYVSTHSYSIFVGYRIVVGSGVLILLSAGLIGN